MQSKPMDLEEARIKFAQGYTLIRDGVELTHFPYTVGDYFCKTVKVIRFILVSDEELGAYTLEDETLLYDTYENAADDKCARYHVAEVTLDKVPKPESPHKHHDVIMAYIKNPKLTVEIKFDTWGCIHNPSFVAHKEYRIKDETQYHIGSMFLYQGKLLHLVRGTADTVMLICMKSGEPFTSPEYMPASTVSGTFLKDTLGLSNIQLADVSLTIRPRA